MQIGTDIPVHSIQQNTSETELCTRSISCDNTYARIAPGVVAIYCVDPVTKTSGLCTGGTPCPNPGRRYSSTLEVVTGACYAGCMDIAEGGLL